MNVLTIIFMAVGLSFDTFAVSLTLGKSGQQLMIKNAMLFALYFGFFQSVMLLIGLFAGLTVKIFVENFADLAAFSLLTFVGLKMIYESTLFKEANSSNPTGFFVLTGLALATSIDALSVGISYSLIYESFIMPLTVLGVVTFVAAISGMLIGKRIGILLGKKLEIVGGIVLIIIAVSVVLS